MNCTAIGTGAYTWKDNQLALGAGFKNILVFDGDTGEIFVFGKPIANDTEIYHGLKEWISMLLAEQRKKNAP